MYYYAKSARESEQRTPLENLHNAYAGVTKGKEVEAGSATAVGVNLFKDGSLSGVKWVSS